MQEIAEHGLRSGVMLRRVESPAWAIVAPPPSRGGLLWMTQRQPTEHRGGRSQVDRDAAWRRNGLLDATVREEVGANRRERGPAPQDGRDVEATVAVVASP